MQYGRLFEIKSAQFNVYRHNRIKSRRMDFVDSYSDGAYDEIMLFIMNSLEPARFESGSYLQE